MAVLTAAQKSTLRTNILADNALTAQVTAQDWDGIAAVYNATASPVFVVWKSTVSKDLVAQQGFSSTELAGLSSLNTQRLQNLAAWFSYLNPSVAAIRAFFDDIFSGAGGVNTRAALLLLWKRNATRLEKLFATGTGSDASPATLGVEGTVSAQTVSDAMGGL